MDKLYLGTISKRKMTKKTKDDTITKSNSSNTSSNDPLPTIQRRGLGKSRLSTQLTIVVFILSLLFGVILYQVLLPIELVAKRDEFVSSRNSQIAYLMQGLFAGSDQIPDNLDVILENWQQTQPHLKRYIVYDKNMALIADYTRSNYTEANTVTIKTVHSTNGTVAATIITDWDSAIINVVTNDDIWRLVSMSIGSAMIFTMPIMIFFTIVVLRHVNRLSRITRNPNNRADSVGHSRLITSEIVDLAEVINHSQLLRGQDQDTRKSSLRLQGYLRSILAAAMDGIIVLDDSGQIASLNPMAENILKTDEAKAKGKPLDSLIKIKERSDQKTNAAGESQILSDNNMVHKTETIKAQIANGLDRYFELSNAQFDSEGEHFSVVILRDITAQQHHQVFLQEAKQQSEDAARAKTQFLAMMSHEIRTPLNGIIGILQLMQNAKTLSNNDMYIEQGMASAESLKRIIGDLLDISRIEAGKVDLENEHFSPRNIAEEEVALSHNLLAGKNLKLKCRIDDDIPNIVDGDSGKIRQVIRNMLSNAIKFTEKGVVLLSVKCLPQSNAKTAKLFFSVQDTGIGIPDGMYDKVFNEFDSVNMAYTRRYGGTGLGMAISKGIVEAMEGRIGFTSEPDKGSNFWFHITLPIVFEKAGYKLEKNDDTLNRALQGIRILVVEDNPTNSMITKHMLEQEKCKVMTAADGVEAIEMVNKFEYDAVFMDVAMPRMDGHEASRAIRKQGGIYTKLPIIAMTAHAAKNDIRAAKNAGMSDYLTKPVDRMKLFATLRKAVLKPTKIKPINAR